MEDQDIKLANYEFYLNLLEESIKIMNLVEYVSNQLDSPLLLLSNTY